MNLFWGYKLSDFWRLRAILSGFKLLRLRSKNNFVYIFFFITTSCLQIFCVIWTRYSLLAVDVILCVIDSFFSFSQTYLLNLDFCKKDSFHLEILRRPSDDSDVRIKLSVEKISVIAEIWLKKRLNNCEYNVLFWKIYMHRSHEI